MIGLSRLAPQSFGYRYKNSVGVSTSAYPGLQAFALPTNQDKQLSKPTPGYYNKLQSFDNCYVTPVNNILGLMSVQTPKMDAYVAASFRLVVKFAKFESGRTRLVNAI